MTVLIAVAIWLGGGFLLALFLGAVFSFSERNEADELQMISSWQMTPRRGSQEAKGVPVVDADQAARPQTAAYAPMGQLVSPAPFSSHV